MMGKAKTKAELYTSRPRMHEPPREVYTPLAMQSGYVEAQANETFLRLLTPTKVQVFRIALLIEQMPPEGLNIEVVLSPLEQEPVVVPITRLATGYSQITLPNGPITVPEGTTIECTVGEASKFWFTMAYRTT